MTSNSHTFVARPNVITGKQEWIFLSNNYDYEQEIARSAYGDMLHDTDRNKKYYTALFKVISNLKSLGKHVHVLDIGTGTGLLAMMAVRCGADKVTACEAFLPIANCAAKVINHNGMSDKIVLINKRSTDITSDDLPERANVLVAEVFDTELIGEGALQTFHHAAKNLLTPDAIVIPTAARIHVQIAESNHLWQHNSLVSPFAQTTVGSLKIPPEVISCSGCPAVYDVQISELQRSDFILLTNPIEVKRFEFNPPASKINMHDKTDFQIQPTQSGVAHVVFMWWELEMEPTGEVQLTCGPRWGLDKPEDYNWRDHWMQAIYFPTQHTKVNKNEDLILRFNHDEYSLWFDITSPKVPFSSCVTDASQRRVRPVCSCGMHVAWNKMRIAQTNSKERLLNLQQVVNTVSTKSTKQPVLVISDGSLMSCLLASKDLDSVHLDQNPLSRRFMELILKSNKDIINSRVTMVSNLDELESCLSELVHPIEAVIGEPYFTTSLLPWHDLHFWYALDYIHAFLAPNVFISPSRCRLMTVLVQFKELWLTRAPIDECEGFDLSPFDVMVHKNSLLTDSLVEPYPLWEYPGTQLSDVTLVCEWDLTQPISQIPNEIINTVRLPILFPGKLNGIAFWCEWELLPNQWYSTGVKKEVDSFAGSILQWNNLCKQGVHLTRIEMNAQISSYVEIECAFKKECGEPAFSFSFEL